MALGSEDRLPTSILIDCLRSFRSSDHYWSPCAVKDFFDVNTYANDPRVGFLNWNMYGGGSYDWTMDKLSWT